MVVFGGFREEEESADENAGLGQEGIKEVKKRVDQTTRNPKSKTLFREDRKKSRRGRSESRGHQLAVSADASPPSPPLFL